MSLAPVATSAFLDHGIPSLAYKEPVEHKKSDITLPPTNTPPVKATVAKAKKKKKHKAKKMDTIDSGKVVEISKADALRKALLSVDIKIDPKSRGWWIEGGINVAMNEYLTIELVDELQKCSDIEDNDVMAFTGAFIGLDYASMIGIASRKPIKHLVCLDLSERVAKFWHAIIPLIKQSTTHLEAYEKICDILKRKPELLQDSTLAQTQYITTAVQKQIVLGSREVPAIKSNSELLQEYAKKEISAWNEWIKMGISWCTESNFEVIKSIFDRNAFIVHSLDMTNPTHIASFTKALEMSGLKLKVYLSSNVRECAETFAPLDQFHQAMKVLTRSSIVSDKTYFIDTYPREGGSLKRERLLARLLRLKQITEEPIEKVFPRSPGFNKHFDLSSSQKSSSYFTDFVNFTTVAQKTLSTQKQSA